MIEIRALSPGDLKKVMSVQRSAYSPELVEPEASFAAKLRVWPRGAIGAFEDGELISYLFCHPWARGETAPLGAASLNIGSTAVLYIHDLAVRADRRGRGIADLLVNEALALASRYRLETALVAVQGSRGFWERYGFEAVKELEYAPGVPSWYMVRPNPERPRASDQS